MASSRLIVKNLPNSVTDVKLRELFNSRGKVTDVQLKYTTDGRFRHFAFVGFNTEDEAISAREYLHNTYFGASKIQVEACSNLGDVNKPRAWSKYAAEKEEVARKSRKKQAELEEDEPHPKKKKEEEILEKCKEDPAFVEFLESHIKKSSWGNDTIMQELESQVLGKPKKDKKDKKKEVAESTEEQVKKAKDSESSEVEAVDGKKDKKKDKKKTLPTEEYFTAKLRNLPKKARKKDLKTFFAPLTLKSIRIPPNLRGFAYVGFKTEKELSQALFKNKSFILGNQISVMKYDNKKQAQLQSENKRNRWEDQETELERETETVGESGRIFIRNLSYETNEDEIRGLFENFGPVTEVHLPIDRITRQLKGFGFVSFLLPEQAAKAFTELDGTIFHGRMLHLLPSKIKDEISVKDIQAGSSFKKSKELKQKKTAGSSHNWNTLFLGQNAVAEIIADKYDVRKEELLLDNADEKNRNIASVGVRMALAETELIMDTKKFLENNGVFLQAFETTGKVPRSNTIMLAKNLPPKTRVNELEELFVKHGVLSRVILPPSGVTAIIEFTSPAEARGAFKKLAYSKFKNLPLYLEWAPVNIFGATLETETNESDKSKSAEHSTSTEDASSSVKEETDKSEVKEKKALKNLITDEDMVPEPDTTLFVKNLNFSTVEHGLKKFFEESGPVYSATVARKKDPKVPGNMLSMGYGFVQFYRAEDAMNALKNQQNGMLQNHTLELKKSNRTLQVDGGSRKETNQAPEDKTGTKLLVRNVPFQASKEEITQLFKTFGELKAVRLPMKLDGSGEHRGFMFIEFYTKQEAKRAYDTLSKSTHLYGRRLVLEWAAQDDTVEELRQKTAKKFDLQTKGALDSQRQRSKQMMRNFEEAQQLKKKQEESDEEDDE